MSRRQLHQSHVPDWAQTQNFQQANTASGTLADLEDMFNSPSRNGNGNGSNRNGGDTHDDPNTNPPEEPPEDAFFALLRQDDESKFMENLSTRAPSLKKKQPPPPPPINKAQQECDEAFFGMLRGSGGGGGKKPDMQLGAVSPRIPTPRSSVESVNLSRPTSSSSLRNSREAPPARRTRRKKPEARNPHDDMVISSGGQGAFSDQTYLDKVIEDDKKKWELMQKKKEKENGRKSKKPTGIKRSNSIPGKSSSTNADPSSSKMNNPKPLSVHRVQSKMDFDVQNGPQGGEKDTRRNLDKRTARLRHAPHFSAAVKYWRVKNEGYNCNYNHREQVYDDSATTSRSINGVSVFVRKRPLFDYEKKRLDYDVVSVKSYSERDCDEVVVHNCGMHPDMKKMLHKPTRYKCSAAFDQFASNDDIFNNVGRPMVEKCLTGSIGTILMYGQTGSGKTYTMTSIEERATGFLFDLIGREEERGEEFTVALKFIELAGKKAVDLLGRKQGAAVKIVDEIMGMGHSVDEVKEEEAGGAEEQELDVGESLLLVNNKSDLPTGRIRADFEEFGVKKMIEMEKSLKMGGDKGSYVLVLMNSGEAASMALARLAGEYPDMLRVDKQTGLQMGLDPSDLGVAKNGGANGPVVTVKWKGAAELEVTSTEQMLKYISVGKSRRATEATDVNGTSSRSHAVLQITLLRKGERGSKKRGVLTLIDCAGSERRNDSMYHDKARQKESAEINNSLWALKNCIRARCEILEKPNTFIPYRSSLLTRVLRESFERDTALLSIIATAAPNATDTEHTMETLKTVSTIVGTEKDVEEIETEQVMQAHKLQEMLVAQGSGGGGGGAEKPTRTVIMPIKWSHEQLKRWLTKARGGEFQQVAKRVVKSDTGKTIMAQTIPKLERSLCQNDNMLATSLYNNLRGESDKIAKVLLKERKSRQALAKGQEAY
ncbi:hypothetical protein TL16_g10669 [Triparma laevis f. inornata]|uniref:Kinesin motor domain-containing protein n=1 Tax=Triparma laevis f. inornata TaxID=1714386 RepID=A0A9W7BAG1_9STRA|nr:hypothetical protein TL16_g10669 [Triparma laevis f. inornata]